MGHWSEGLVDELLREIGGNHDRQMLADKLAQAGHEIEILSGRSFNPARRTTSIIAANGLPFVDIPDMQVGSMESQVGAWEIADPVDPRMASVLQVSPTANPALRAAPVADALWNAGLLLAGVSQAGCLSRDYVLRWLGTVPPEERTEIFRQVMDPAVRFSIPIAAADANGWWIQITRRLIWVTGETEDEGQLFEILLDKAAKGDKPIPLVATEPRLIVARTTHQPADLAISARIWTQGVQRPTDRPWAKISRAVHGHGIPTVTLDSDSSPAEIACQLILKGYWHGYVGADEPALANALSIAYPRQVERIRRDTHAPDHASAAATLLEQLIQPGFDPARGAEATRRYVRRKASIAVMEYKKRETPDQYPWTQVGISERRYYKLLPLFAEKTNGRYDIDRDDVVARMKAHLDRTESTRELRAAALSVLQSHGFSDGAARKWLQRHRPEDAIDAWPRRSSPHPKSEGDPDRSPSAGPAKAGA